MASINTYSDITAFVNSVFDDALFVARDNNVMTTLVTTFSGQGMFARKLQTYGTVTLNAVGEADDLTSQAFTPSALSTLTPAEFGAQVFLTDQRIDSDIFGARQDAALELGAAMGQKIELDLVSNFSSLTGGTVGGGGSALTWGRFAAARSLLRAQNAPMPYVTVLSPGQWFTLGTAVIPAGSQTNAPNFQDEVMRNWYVGTVLGVDIFVSSNITAGTASAGAMFSRAALAFDSRRAPRIEPERDASRRGWELNASMIYAHGVWRPKFGVTMFGDGTLPNNL